MSAGAELTASHTCEIVVLMERDSSWEQRLRTEAKALIDVTSDERIAEALQASNVADAIRALREQVLETHHCLRERAAEKMKNMTDDEYQQFNVMADQAPPHSMADFDEALATHRADIMLADAIERADFLDGEDTARVVSQIIEMRFQAQQYLAGFDVHLE